MIRKNNDLTRVLYPTVLGDSSQLRISFETISNKINLYYIYW